MGKITTYYQEYGCLLTIIAAIVIFACIGLFYTVLGFVFMELFNWIVPIYWTNAPHLTLLQSIGTVFFVLIIGSFIKSIFEK